MELEPNPSFDAGPAPDAADQAQTSTNTDTAVADDDDTPDGRQDWFIPLDSQQRIMTRLIGIADGTSTEGKNADPRTVLGAARVVGLFSKLVLEQQKLDQQAGRHAADQPVTLEELTRRAHQLRRYRQEQLVVAAQQQGVAGIELLDEASRRAAHERARAQWQAEQQPAAPRTDAALRQVWPVTPAQRRRVVARLVDLADPQGVAGRVLPLRYLNAAGRTLAFFGRLAQEQQRLDLQRRSAPPACDLAAVAANAMRRAQERLRTRDSQP